MRLADLLKRASEYVFVPTCVFCGVRLPSEKSDREEANVFCEKCAEKYERAQGENCAVCNQGLGTCLCSNDFMKQNGLANLVKIFYYRPNDEDAVQNGLIYTLKRTKNQRAIDFCVYHLEKSIRTLVPHLESFTVTYAPRSAKAKRIHGHDQSELIARELARRLSLPFESTLVRDRRATEQKFLEREARLRNMRGRYRVKEKMDLRGKKYLLFDDVVTSGATMLSAAKALRHEGATRVIGVTAGISYRQVTAAQRNRLERKYALKGMKRTKKRKRSALPPMAVKF
ncbi:MAG: ComF family protein [Clostridia bacterium]|nr:ComF family protein [Clostridia bacterium]